MTRHGSSASLGCHVQSMHVCTSLAWRHLLRLCALLPVLAFCEYFPLHSSINLGQSAGRTPCMGFHVQSMQE